MIYCRVAPSLGELEGTPKQVWGTLPYNPEKHIDKPCVFFGLYGLPDFYALWRHKGKKWILWCGTDIQHFKNGYWLDDKGDIRINLKALADWINKYCESWVENKVEYEALREMGIESQICPSFLGDITKFKVNYKWREKPKVYTSVSGDNFELYGWDKIPDLAYNNPDIEFHLYGDKEKVYPDALNIVNHGRVPKEQMNEEIKSMQGALRLTEFDGASEIIVKAMLMGQYAFSFIEYPFVDKVESLSSLKSRKEANLKGKDWWINNLNKFQWNLKK